VETEILKYNADLWIFTRPGHHLPNWLDVLPDTPKCRDMATSSSKFQLARYIVPNALL